MPQKTLLPSIAVVIGGAMWGVFWIPLREIGESGLRGAWPGLLVYAISALLLLPLLIGRGGRVRGDWRCLVLGGLFTGIAFTLYAVSIFMTDVVRVILLFYITPVWGTLLGVFYLNEKITTNRILALSLGFAGLITILGAGIQFPWPKNAGDWLALIAGMAWAYGTFWFYRNPKTDILEQALAFIFGSMIASALALLLGGAWLNGSADIASLKAAFLPAFVTALFVVPMVFLTLWPASILSPGRVGMLLLSEVVVGVGSAAWLGDETFGIRELTGAVFVVAAGIVEVMGKSSTPDASAPLEP